MGFLLVLSFRTLSCLVSTKNTTRDYLVLRVIERRGLHYGTSSEGTPQCFKCNGDHNMAFSASWHSHSTMRWHFQNYKRSFFRDVSRILIRPSGVFWNNDQKSDFILSCIESEVYFTGAESDLQSIVISLVC